MTVSNQNEPELSVVVLGYRAGVRLKPFISELADLLKENDIDYQIVLVGNYWPESGDDTPEVVRELSLLDCRIKPIIRLKRGRMGWDMRSGLEAADGRFISVIDGDGQMPAKDVFRVYQKIKNEDLDFVQTYRQKRFDNLWRRITSFSYNGIFRILFPGLNMHDINSKPKIFTRHFFDKLELFSDDWFSDAEIVIQVRRHKARTGEIPTVFNRIEGRDSFVNVLTIFEFIKNLIVARIKELKL